MATGVKAAVDAKDGGTAWWIPHILDSACIKLYMSCACRPKKEASAGRKTAFPEFWNEPLKVCAPLPETFVLAFVIQKELRISTAHSSNRNPIAL